jgi:hypothetical protein
MQSAKPLRPLALSQNASQPKHSLPDIRGASPRTPACSSRPSSRVPPRFSRFCENGEHLFSGEQANLAGQILLLKAETWYRNRWIQFLGLENVPNATKHPFENTFSAPLHTGRDTHPKKQPDHERAQSSLQITHAFPCFPSDQNSNISRGSRDCLCPTAADACAVCPPSTGTPINGLHPWPQHTKVGQTQIFSNS